MEEMYPVPFNTGNKRMDFNLTAIRYSGSAWWLMLGMMVIQEAVVYANNTEAAHIIKRPIKAATSTALASSGQFLIKHSWVLGPALLATARLLKRRDTNGCDSKLDRKGRHEIHDLGNSFKAGVTEAGQSVVEVKASQLLKLATLVRSELKNTEFPESHTGALSPEAISKLLGDSKMESDVNFSVVMDIESSFEPEPPTTLKEILILRNKISVLLKSGEIEKAVECGISMFKYTDIEPQSYENQADAADYIAALSESTVDTWLEEVSSQPWEQVTDSFLAALNSVRGTTNDLELMAKAMGNPSVLRAVYHGVIRTELKLKLMLQAGSNTVIKKAGRGR